MSWTIKAKTAWLPPGGSLQHSTSIQRTSNLQFKVSGILFFSKVFLTLMQILEVNFTSVSRVRMKKRGKHKAGTYPWFLGSSHCVVLVGWCTKYTLPFVSVLFSEEKKNPQKTHHRDASVRWCTVILVHLLLSQKRVQFFFFNSICN